MKKNSLIILLLNIFLFTGCSAETYNHDTCPVISNQFNTYKYKKISCMVTNDNRQDDEEACLYAKQKLFASNFREYLQPFYDEAVRVDEYLKNGEQVKINIPQVDLPYCSDFCYKLNESIYKLFKVSDYKVKALNELYKAQITQHWNTLKRSLIIHSIILPQECKEPLQNLRKYKIRSKNKKDDYYRMYRKEYVDCLNFYIKTKGKK
jgi:hypothetical protein